MIQVGRNDPCPCGSGKKYKKCCLPNKEALRSPWREAWSYAEKKALIKSSENYPVDQCLINPDWKETGQARIVVTRRQENGNFIIGVYLVDTFCLGVKSAFCNAEFTADEVNKTLLSRCYFDQQPEEINLDYAKAIILGAIEYAGNLGFEPDPDFKLARCVLGSKEPEEEHHIRFGGPNGKPFYVAGPNDDKDAIVQKLSRHLGQGGFDYILSA